MGKANSTDENNVSTEHNRLKIPKKESHLTIRQAGVLLAISVIFLGISFLYLSNIIAWSNNPDFGWTITFETGSLMFSDVYGEAEKAGLKKGDRIFAINGSGVTTYAEVQKHLNRIVGEENRYSVLRDGQAVGAVVPNVRLGLKKAFIRFGFTWLLGLCFFFLGALVVLMKPARRSSWVFLAMMFTAGIYITFTFASKFLWPFMNTFFLFAVSFLPACVLQLTATFPQERVRILKYPVLFWSPFALSLGLFVAMRSSAPQFSDVPVVIAGVSTVYLALSLLLFLVSVVHTLYKPDSPIANLRSRVILMGTGAAVILPVTNIIAIRFLGKTIIPHPALNLPFYLFFPVSVAYAIAKHNLFDVDVFIKRTVGYALMTVLVGGIYFSLQLSVKSIISVSGFGVFAEQAYPVIFALLVVFFFNPVNRRIQLAVDKMFYRKQFDYKDTVNAVSSALTTVFDLDKIIKQIIYTVKREMFIDSAGVILLQPESEECDTLFVHDVPNSREERIEEDCLDQGDPMVAVMLNEKKLITVYDIQEDPHYAHTRESVGKRFSALNATLALPLKYQDKVTGILALGQKKSGHFYSREDIELLETLANQGAIGIENAKMADQMKQEETVRANLARYLSPQIVEQVIHKDVEVNLGGARKEVTVLFSDIRKFTTITETRPPDELVAILNEYFTEMAKIIFENQGSLDKYIGDAIVAVFGSLIPLENPAQNAVCAAVDMMKRMPELNRKWAEQFEGFTMEIGIGVNTGEVFLGNIGSPERMEFTVIGDTVNVASRFSDMAQPGQILATRATVKELGDTHECISLPPSQVKGKSGELEVFGISYDTEESLE